MSNNWFNTYHHYTNTHLIRYALYHNLILLRFNFDCLYRHNQHAKFIRFETDCTTNEESSEVVNQRSRLTQANYEQKQQQTLHNLLKWGKKTFGAIPNQRGKDLENLHTQNPGYSPL